MLEKQHADNENSNEEAEKHFPKNSNEIIFSLVSQLPLDGMEMVQKPKYIPQGRHLPRKSWLKLTHPLQKAVSFDTFCLVARQW